MNVIHLIEADHRHIETAFERFDRAARNGDERQQTELARDLLRQLSVHAAVEEQVLYPALSRAGVSSERLEALEDHHAVKVSLSELQAMTPGQERYAPKMRVIEKSVRRHIEEEESTLLPRLRDALDTESLQRLGAEIEAAKRSAPTRPHPAAPDEPPANFFANAAAAMSDRLVDALDSAGDLLRASVRYVLGGTLRFGRDAAFRARQDGEVMASQVRARGERAVERVRAAGAEIVEGAADQGAEVARRIEHRGATASRELRARALRGRAGRRNGRGAGSRDGHRAHRRRR